MRNALAHGPRASDGVADFPTVAPFRNARHMGIAWVPRPHFPANEMRRAPPRGFNTAPKLPGSRGRSSATSQNRVFAPDDPLSRVLFACGMVWLAGRDRRRVIEPNLQPCARLVPTEREEGEVGAAPGAWGRSVVNFMIFISLFCVSDSYLFALIENENNKPEPTR